MRFWLRLEWSGIFHTVHCPPTSCHCIPCRKKTGTYIKQANIRQRWYTTLLLVWVICLLHDYCKTFPLAYSLAYTVVYNKKIQHTLLFKMFFSDMNELVMVLISTLKDAGHICKYKEDLQ